MLVKGFHFFRSSELQFQDQLPDIGLPLKGFDKQRVPIRVRYFWTILPLPQPQKPVKLSKNK